jgi:asparagine synthase (glutamine-hydrolysing)
MCGLFGHTTFEPDGLAGYRETLNTLAHRGPDQWGEWHDDRVYVGHRRLSVIDPSESARQPMVSPDARTVLTANGEIYNFRKLRRELEARYSFQSRSDSEVLLHGYREWGIDELVQRIEGIYAFCIYDSVSRRIYLVRDRVGTKPLYYALHKGCFAWASELKALRFHLNESLEVDPTALYDFLTYLYVPAPKSLYKHVFKLEPAHYLCFDLESVSVTTKRYWDLNCHQTPIAPAEAAERFRQLFRTTVKQQLVSDVPLSFFLSGGMDSSALVAEACAVSDHVHTCSIGFDVEEHDETRFAEIVSSQFKTDHQTRVLSQLGAADILQRFCGWFDEPFADSSALPTYLVSQVCRETSTVALTGDGGDEVLGGYDWYLTYPLRHGRRIAALSALQPGVSKIKNHFNNLIGRAASRLEWRLLDDLELYTKLMSGMIREDKHAYSACWEIPRDYDDYWHYRRYWRQELPLRRRLQYLDFHTILPDRFLTKVDRVSMAVSLEARVPLLGTDLVQFCFSLPEDVLYLGGSLKGLFKFAYRDILPREILDRGKKGFSAPVRAWSTLFTTRQLRLQEQILLRLFAEQVGLDIPAAVTEKARTRPIDGIDHESS